MIDKKLIKAEMERIALFQMYQAGFLDGWNVKSKKLSVFHNTMKKKCIQSFEIRFMKAIKDRLKGGKNGRNK